VNAADVTAGPDDQIVHGVLATSLDARRRSPRGKD
jgi:hypothetical protein